MRQSIVTFEIEKSYSHLNYNYMKFCTVSLRGQHDISCYSRCSPYPKKDRKVLTLMVFMNPQWVESFYKK